MRIRRYVLLFSRRTWGIKRRNVARVCGSVQVGSFPGFYPSIKDRRSKTPPLERGKERRIVLKIEISLRGIIIVLLLALGVWFFTSFYFENKDKTIFDVYMDWAENIIKDMEEGTILEDHPSVNNATESEDYKFAKTQMEEFNVHLSDLDQYLFDAIHEGKLEYVYTGHVEREAGRFYVYGDGFVYRIFCSPAEVCAMPILSSLVFNAYQGSATLKTAKCVNAWDVYWTCGGFGDSFKYDLYSKLS